MTAFVTLSFGPCLFTVDLVKTRTRHYTSQCSTAPTIPTFPGPQFSEMGTHGSEVGKQAFRPFKPAIPRLGTPWFQDWETWAPTLGNPPFL